MTVSMTGPRRSMQVSSTRLALIWLGLLLGLSLAATPAHATDCPPGSLSDCQAVLSGPWNPLIPLIGAVLGAGVGGLISFKPSKEQPGGPGGPRPDQGMPETPASMPEPPLQVERPQVPPSQPSLPGSGPSYDSVPEAPVRPVTLAPEGPAPLPPSVPTMQSTGNLIVGPDGSTVRVTTDIAQPVGTTTNDATPGDGRYQDRQGNPVGAPAGFSKTEEVVFKTHLAPGLFSSGNPIVDEFFYSGSDTLPGTGIPGTPSTTETSDPRVRYKRIVYDNPETHMRVTYIFYRVEGPLAHPLIDEGTYKMAGPARMTRIPK